MTRYMVFSVDCEQFSYCIDLVAADSTIAAMETVKAHRPENADICAYTADALRELATELENCPESELLKKG